MIDRILRGIWLKDYKEGDKAIIFCASIDFATYLTNFLKTRYQNFDVRRYVEEDPFENLMEADVRVTTLISAGTAVDIAQLTTTVMTTSISSSQANEQGIGRLRPLKDGRTPEFAYLVCEDIEKQIEYHEKKRGIINDLAASYRNIHMDVLI
jgi:superfamily II DNA or RNA helicase